VIGLIEVEETGFRTIDLETFRELVGLASARLLQLPPVEPGFRNASAVRREDGGSAATGSVPVGGEGGYNGR